MLLTWEFPFLALESVRLHQPRNANGISEKRTESSDVIGDVRAPKDCHSAACADKRSDQVICEGSYFADLTVWSLFNFDQFNCGVDTPRNNPR